MNTQSLIQKLTSKTARFLIVGLSVALITSGAVAINSFQKGPETVIAQGQDNFHPGPQPFIAQADNGKDVTFTVELTGHSLSNTGLYQDTYTFVAQPNLPEGHRDYSSVSFQIKADTHLCSQGNGNTANICDNPISSQTPTINLNAGNNFTQSITLTAQQNPALACGSFQTDLFRNGSPLNAATLLTGKDVSSCLSTPTPTPTATPTATPTPVPTPTASPTPAPVEECKANEIKVIKNSQAQCQAQTQTQNNNQSQDNNQTQTQGSISNTNSNNVTVNNPAPQVLAATSAPQVVTVAASTAKELPKTGLPLAGLALTGLIPFGLKLRKYSQKDNPESSANFIWEERQIVKDNYFPS